MPATDDQRAWLEKAISERGRLTRKKSIEKDFEKYIRRRDKVEEAVKALTWSGEDSKIRNALRDADNEAKNGKFDKAYKHLDSVKKRARAAATGRGDALDVEALADRVFRFEQTINARVVLNRVIEQNLTEAVAEVQTFEKAKDQATFDAAIQTWSVYRQREPFLTGKVTEAHKLVARLTEECKRPDMNNEPETIEREMTAAGFAGREDEIARIKAQYQRAYATYSSEQSKLKKETEASALVTQKTLEFERFALEIKDMSAWQNRDAVDETDDPQEVAKFGVRDKVLEKTKNWDALQAAEEARHERAKAQVLKERLRDISLIPKQGERGDMDLTPEPVPFSGTAVFGDLLDLDAKLPDEIPEDRAAELEQAAADALKSFIATTDAKSDELFDLTLKSSQDFEEILCEELFGTASMNGLTRSQIAFLEKAAKTLEKTLAANSPNKMKDDGSEISINGETYTYLETIKAGGNGMARRYQSGAGDKTIVVKTMNNSRDVEKMKEEMRTHRRAMNGIDTDDPADSAIVNMEGAALSENNGEVQVHMVMEDVDGGDLDDMTNAMSVMESMGIIPESARQILAMEMVADTAKALMELERQGLAHHDIKGENVMMMADGRIKIIDYGESAFADDDGTVRNAAGGSTAGYEAPEGRGQEFDTRVDIFALGGMIERMVGRMSPTQKMDFESGAMGDLVRQLKDADPDKRPSLEAVLMSSLMQSSRTDYAEDDVKDLQEASREMALEVAKTKVTIDSAALIHEIPDAKSLLKGDEVKLKTLQQIADALAMEIQGVEQKYANDADGYLSTGKYQIAELERQRDLLEKGIIKKAMENKAAEGKRAMDEAVEDGVITIDYTVRNSKKTKSLKDALADRDKIVKGIADLQEKFYQNISQNEDVDMKLVDTINEKLTELDEIRKSIDAAIYDAVGSDAKFYLSKVKVEDVAKRFGPSTAPRAQPAVEEDKIDDLVNMLLKSPEVDEVRKAVASA